MAESAKLKLEAGGRMASVKSLASEDRICITADLFDDSLALVVHDTTQKHDGYTRLVFNKKGELTGIRLTGRAIVTYENP